MTESGATRQISDGQQRIESVRWQSPDHAASCRWRAAKDVINQNQYAGHGIATDKFTGTIHGSVKSASMLRSLHALLAISSWPMMPALRSASMAICLPGIAPEAWNLALTSETCLRLLVTTTK